MKGSNYDVLLLRPQEIADVIDMSKAIDLVEQGYREAQDFPRAPSACPLPQQRENFKFPWRG